MECERKSNVYHEDGKIKIRCNQCNFLIFDGEAMRNRLALIRDGHIVIKCKRCGAFTSGLPLTIFTEEES